LGFYMLDFVRLRWRLHKKWRMAHILQTTTVPYSSIATLDELLDVIKACPSISMSEESPGTFLFQHCTYGCELFTIDDMKKFRKHYKRHSAVRFPEDEEQEEGKEGEAAGGMSRREETV